MAMVSHGDRNGNNREHGNYHPHCRSHPLIDWKFCGWSILLQVFRYLHDTLLHISSTTSLINCWTNRVLTRPPRAYLWSIVGCCDSASHSQWRNIPTLCRQSLECSTPRFDWLHPSPPPSLSWSPRWDSLKTAFRLSCSSGYCSEKFLKLR